MKHSGAITKINNSTITVALEANINCESCKAKAACGVSESNAKEIEIENPLNDLDNSGQLFQLNEQVDVLMREELGLKAVLIGSFCSDPRPWLQNIIMITRVDSGIEFFINTLIITIQ